MQVIGSHLAPAGEPVRQNSDNQSHQNKVSLKLLENHTYIIFFQLLENHIMIIFFLGAGHLCPGTDGGLATAARKSW